MASALPKPWTVDEFLAWEREQAKRCELVDGVVRMMTGGTLAHTIVKGNLFAALRARVAMPCRVLVDGAKVVTATASLYPDVLVTCAPVIMTDDSVHEPAIGATLEFGGLGMRRRILGDVRGHPKGYASKGQEAFAPISGGDGASRARRGEGYRCSFGAARVECRR